MPAADSFGMVAATSSAAIERVVHAALFPAAVRPEEAMTAIGASVVVRFVEKRFAWQKGGELAKKYLENPI